MARPTLPGTEKGWEPQWSSPDTGGGETTTNTYPGYGGKYKTAQEASLSIQSQTRGNVISGTEVEIAQPEPTTIETGTTPILKVDDRGQKIIYDPRSQQEYLEGTAKYQKFLTEGGLRTEGPKAYDVALSAREGLEPTTEDIIIGRSIAVEQRKQEAKIEEFEEFKRGGLPSITPEDSPLVFGIPRTGEEIGGKYKSLFPEEYKKATKEAERLELLRFERLRKEPSLFREIEFKAEKAGIPFTTMEALLKPHPTGPAFPGSRTELDVIKETLTPGLTLGTYFVGGYGAGRLVGTGLLKTSRLSPTLGLWTMRGFRVGGIATAGLEAKEIIQEPTPMRIGQTLLGFSGFSKGMSRAGITINEIFRFEKMKGKLTPEQKTQYESLLKEAKKIGVETKPKEIDVSRVEGISKKANVIFKNEIKKTGDIVGGSIAQNTQVTSKYTKKPGDVDLYSKHPIKSAEVLAKAWTEAGIEGVAVKATGQGMGRGGKISIRGKKVVEFHTMEMRSQHPFATSKTLKTPSGVKVMDIREQMLRKLAGGFLFAPTEAPHRAKDIPDFWKIQKSLTEPIPPLITKAPKETIPSILSTQSLTGTPKASSLFMTQPKVPSPSYRPPSYRPPSITGYTPPYKQPKVPSPSYRPPSYRPPSITGYTPPYKQPKVPSPSYRPPSTYKIFHTKPEIPIKLKLPDIDNQKKPTKKKGKQPKVKTRYTPSLLGLALGIEEEGEGITLKSITGIGIRGIRKR